MNKVFLKVIPYIIICSLFCSCNLFHNMGKKHTDTYSYDAPYVIRDVPTNHAILPPLDTTIAQADKLPKTIDSAAIRQQRIAEVAPLWKRRLHYTTFSGKAKISFLNPGEGADDAKEFTAYFRIRKDSIIWIQLTILGGIQVARVCITPDSFYMMSVVERYYIRKPISQINKVLPAQVEFASLQNMITGDPLRDGNITCVKDSGKLCTIQVEDNGYVQNVCYNMTDSTIESTGVCTHDVSSPSALIRFLHYEMQGEFKLSMRRALSVNVGKDQYSAEINFQNMQFDVPLEFPFSIPQSFKERE